MLRLTASTRRVATGRWIHRGGAVREAATVRQPEQRDCGITEPSSALKSATLKVSLKSEEETKKKLGVALVRLCVGVRCILASHPPVTEWLAASVALHLIAGNERALQEPIHPRWGILAPSFTSVPLTI